MSVHNLNRDELLRPDMEHKASPTHICQDARTGELIFPSPYERAAATIVAMPFVPYQAATRSGCSDRRYHAPVMTENRGRHPASKSPKMKRTAMSPPKLWAAGVHVCATPQPSSIVGIRMRGGTLIMRMEENGCQTSCAMGAMEPTRE